MENHNFLIDALEIHLRIVGLFNFRFSFRGRCFSPLEDALVMLIPVRVSSKHCRFLKSSLFFPFFCTTMFDWLAVRPDLSVDLVCIKSIGVQWEAPPMPGVLGNLGAFSGLCSVMSK